MYSLNANDNQLLSQTRGGVSFKELAHSPQWADRRLFYSYFLFEGQCWCPDSPIKPLFCAWGAGWMCESWNYVQWPFWRTSSLTFGNADEIHWDMLEVNNWKSLTMASSTPNCWMMVTMVEESVGTWWYMTHSMSNHFEMHPRREQSKPEIFWRS